MKKILIIVCFIFASNVNAKDSMVKFDYKKTSEIVEMVVDKNLMIKNEGCDDEYLWQVSLANDFLFYCLENPPSGANNFYYDSVWTQFNMAITGATINRKLCNSL